MPIIGLAGGVVKKSVNQGLGFANSAIESWAYQNVPQLRLIEIDSRLRNDSKPDVRVIGLIELTDREYESYLSQFSFSTFDDRETLNIGLVWRGINKSKTLIYGVNVFYDREFNSNHSRLGVGFETKSSVYDLNINFYAGLSDKKEVDGSIEEAADGHDIEVGLYVPYMPWAKIYYKGYRWDSSIYDIVHGEVLSLHMQPSNRFSIEAGLQNDNTMDSDRQFIKLNYILCCNIDTNTPIVFVTPYAYSYKVIENRFFERVRRENNIVKGVKGAVVVGRGT